ncbi:replication-relaxation family protein [Streptomyces sp. NBC_01381]|uniref:replication-relaxation family protein n=1 Tax=Streptomyces sp. NBC_01381 TaxID=2903845 RepID=UPI00224EAE53|nr:replication-relaxation family protein [Streptomyces sp. NBC_01381]MCX4673653.1 replication-relaxation family protein [Streptomyces sp. NBC_01381]
MPTAPVCRPSLSRLAQELLPVLYTHRLLTAAQLNRLLRPQTTSNRYMRSQLQALQEHGLADATVRHHNHVGELLWYATALGADAIEAGQELPSRSYRITERAAASALQEHTLAINETGLAMTEHARRLGDECGPLSWDMEVLHRVRDGARHGDEAWLTPDAVLRYTRTDGNERRLLNFFIEVDRTTMSVARLAAKLHAYARYATYIPQPAPGRSRHSTNGDLVQEAWRERYPTLPRILIVLTGAPEPVLARRAWDLRALAAADTRLQRAAARTPLQAGVTSLGLLGKHGPFAPIVTPLLGEDATATDVLLQPRSPAAV